MHNFINKLAITFTEMNRLVLLLLIMFPLTGFLELPSGDDEYSVVNNILQSIGGFCLLCWIYSIAYKAKQKLNNNSIRLNSLKYFDWIIGILIASYLLAVFFSKTVHTTYNGISIHYNEPVFLSALFYAAFLFTIGLTSKILVSAEKNREVDFGESFTTLLQLLFAPIGLWWVQPRVRKL